MAEVRTPEEILDLYNRLKEKKRGEGKSYLQMDFLNDLGYKHKQRFREITTGKYKVSVQANKLMDWLENSL